MPSLEIMEIVNLQKSVKDLAEAAITQSKITRQLTFRLAVMEVAFGNMLPYYIADCSANDVDRFIREAEKEVSSLEAVWNADVIQLPDTPPDM